MIHHVGGERICPRSQRIPSAPAFWIEAIKSLELFKIECVVPDRIEGPVVEAIQRSGHSDNPRDGKIFGYGVVDAGRYAPGNAGSRRYVVPGVGIEPTWGLHPEGF